MAITTIYTYPLDGTQRDFNIPFEYLARRFVALTLIGTDRRELTLTAEYRFTSKTSVQTNVAWGPADGYERIEIRRNTSATDRLVDFADGSILRASEMNTAQVQTLHVAEEARNMVADTIAENADGDLDARGRRIANVADALSPGDAINKRMMQNWDSSALNSAVRAEAAAGAAEVSQVAAAVSAAFAQEQADRIQPEHILRMGFAIEPVAGGVIDWEGKLLGFIGGQPIPVAPVTDSALDLRMDLLNHAAAGKGAELITKVAVQLPDMATLKGRVGRYDGDVCEIRSYWADRAGIGGGQFYWDAESAEADNWGTIIQVNGVPTGRWKRKVGYLVLIDWFGPRLDAGDQQPRLQAAHDAVPSGGAVLWPKRQEIYPCDIPVRAWRPAGITITKPCRVLGWGLSGIKVMDFCTAWSDFSAREPVGIQGIVSDVTIDGIVVDANADKHYEIDGSGKKHWEVGPTLKRPPNGITIQASVGAPKIENSHIRRCIILRPLAGVTLAGTLSSVGAPALDDYGFMVGTIATDIVENCTATDNYIYRARGNDALCVAGARGCYLQRNYSLDSQYHQARLYAACIDCHILDNRAYMDYARIESRYNSADLGYWRNDNVGGENYKIQRSGYCIGSSYVNTAVGTGNIVGCTMQRNTITYRGNVSGANIVDFTQQTLTSFFVWTAVGHILVCDNVSINTPASGLGHVIATTSNNNVAQGVLLENNRIYNSGRQGIWGLGYNAIYRDNKLINCNQPGSGVATVVLQGASKCYRNLIHWSKPGVSNTNTPFEVIAYGPTGAYFVSDNEVMGYAFTSRMALTGSPVVHGTDAGGVPFSVINGWNAAPSGDIDLVSSPRATINCAGWVFLQGFIGKTGTTSSVVIGQLLLMYRPPSNIFFTVWKTNGTATQAMGRVKRDGTIEVPHSAFASGDTFYLTATWQVPLTL